MNTRLLGISCIIGGLVYLTGGVWLAIAGTPIDPAEVRIAHLFSVIWACGGLCGLLGMLLTTASGTGRFARAALSLPAVGLILVIIDAVVALFVSNPLSPFAVDTPSPLSRFSRLFLLIGLTILTVWILRAKPWTGWKSFIPLVMLLALFASMLFTTKFGIGFLQLSVIGLSWALAGFGVLTQHINT